MTIPLFCLMIVALMPYGLAYISGQERAKLPGGFDNHNPRQQLQQLSGIGARAWAAQMNAWESLGLFTVAVVVAHLAGAASAVSAVAAVVFLIARFVHAWAYIKDRATIRSLSTMVGLLCVLVLFGLAVVA